MRFGGLILAIVLAAIAAIVVLKMTNNPQPPAPSATVTAPEEKGVNIYVAAQPITIGSTITAEMLTTQAWPEHLVLPGFIVADNQSQSIAGKAVGSDQTTVGAQNIIKSVARADFQMNEPIISTKLANPNDPNFLAANLPKGMRIVTINTNESEGLAGFIFPGDHVDVILTHDVQREELKQTANASTGTGGANQQFNITKVPVQEPVTETLLNNVTVLAVDQRASGTSAYDKDGRLIIPRTVSLMVSQVDAQRLRLGQKVGTLTLSLRALADKDAADPATIIGNENLTQYKAPAPTIGGAAGGIVVYRGATNNSDAGSNGGAVAPITAPQALPPSNAVSTTSTSSSAGH